MVIIKFMSLEIVFKLGIKRFIKSWFYNSLMYLMLEKLKQLQLRQIFDQTNIQAMEVAAWT